ncbi:hypothetical protein [Sinomicrobium soli]|uniref:hypothetical protein n=1 Tax=Sinomicrobium sp. N-1-3-6 TaxID=2219864 RepID=UPI000DCB3154|nr:hypothetical protein [Sinomicrobium sp. N-1-3-6]RAV28721.1 hypothetical protein DN748_12290 [Sinomicrobium sp. N-1-3-6]
MGPVKKVKFDCGILEFHEHYVICEMFEGIHLDTENFGMLVSLCREHFGERPFGYISHRIYSYSIDPCMYSETNLISNCIAIAAVVCTSAQRLSSRVEQIFCKKPFEYFYNLEEAELWVSDKVRQSLTD